MKTKKFKLLLCISKQASSLFGLLINQKHYSSSFSFQGVGYSSLSGPPGPPGPPGPQGPPGFSGTGLLSYGDDIWSDQFRSELIKYITSKTQHTPSLFSVLFAWASCFSSWKSNYGPYSGFLPRTDLGVLCSSWEIHAAAVSLGWKLSWEIKSVCYSPVLRWLQWICSCKARQCHFMEKVCICAPLLAAKRSIAW